MTTTTLDDLLADLNELRDQVGGGARVRVAYQPSWPLRGTVAAISAGPDLDREASGDDDGPAADEPPTVWLAVGEVDSDESPHAPHDAWSGALNW